MILLDTNVVSEMMKPEPAARVVSWMEREPASSLYVTSITQAEIMHGVMLLPQGRRRKALEAAAQAMFSEDFAERLLAFGKVLGEHCLRGSFERLTPAPLRQQHHPVHDFRLCDAGDVKAA